MAVIFNPKNRRKGQPNQGLLYNAIATNMGLGQSGTTTYAPPSPMGLLQDPTLADRALADRKAEEEQEGLTNNPAMDRSARMSGRKKRDLHAKAKAIGMGLGSQASMGAYSGSPYIR